MTARENRPEWQYDKEQNKKLLEIINAVNELAGKEPEKIELLKNRELDLYRWPYAEERSLLLEKLKAAIGGLDFSDTASLGDLSGKLDRNQGEENAGKALVVNEDGDIEPGIDTAQLATTAFVGDAVAAAQLAVQTWLPAVDTKAELPDPASLSHTTSYLCRVKKDSDPDNNGVWQLIAGATDWTPFSDNLDFVDETDLEAAIDNAVNSNDTGTITPETAAFAPNTGFTFAAFFAAVVKKINGIIQALAGKQDALVNQTNIKSINGASLLGPGNIDVLAANFQSRVQVLSAGKDSLWKLQIGTGWSGNVRSGILELFYAAEYNSAYARVYISWKSGRANNYTFQILESWRSSGTGEFIEVVSAEGGWLTFKVKHPNPEYSTGMRLYWNSPFADWPIQAAE